MLSLELNGRCRLEQTMMLHEVAEPVGPQFVVPCLLMSQHERRLCVQTPQELQREG
jgi:hypothetical protein